MTTFVTARMMGGGLAAALSVVLAYSPVTAVFSLVVVFVCSSVLMIRMHREFMGLVFLRVYVGAIAVLFLFVVRMLNIQPQSPIRRARDRRRSVPMLLVVASLMWLQLEEAVRPAIGGTIDQSMVWVQSLDAMTDVSVLGQVLYTHTLPLFLTAGFVLLVARVGAVALVMGIPTGAAIGARRQQVSQQLSRDAARAVFRVRGTGDSDTRGG